MSHIFISYSTRDSKYAVRLAEKLRAEGFDVWIDNNRLRSSEDWWRSIVLAIDSCAAFVVILTPNSDQSKWVQREITLADQRNKPVFPLLLAGDIDTPNWALFVRTQYEDVRDGHLPAPSFFAKLTDYAPRRRDKKGVNAVSSVQPKPTIHDPALQSAIETPPLPEAKPRRQSFGWLVFIIALAIALVVGAIAFSEGDALADMIRQLRQGSGSRLSAEQYFALGFEAADREDYDEAIQQFTQALEAGYDPPAEALTARGHMRRLKDEPVEAIGDYESAIEIDPEFAQAYMGLGAAYADTGQHNRAIDAFNWAYELGRGTVLAGQALVEMGQVFRDDGNTQAAIDHFEQALNESADTDVLIGAHRELGGIFREIGEYMAAAFHFQRLTELYPEETVNYLQLAEAYDLANEPNAALDALHLYVEAAEQYGDPVDEAVIQRIAELERNLP